MKKNSCFNVIKRLACITVYTFFVINMFGQSTSRPLPQFLYQEFKQGILLMKDGRKLSAIIDYNMLDEKMVFEQKGIYMILDKPYEIDTVYLDNSKFVYNNDAFFEVAGHGPVTIFIQHKCHLSPAGSATAYGMTSKTLGPTAVWSMNSGNQFRNLDLPPNVEISDITVYWVLTDGKMNKFLNERQLLKCFPGYETQIKDFIKSSKIDIKTSEGLKEMANFCNSLKNK